MLESNSNVSGGNSGNASGGSKPAENNEDKKNEVSYESFQKLLDEKKAMQAKLEKAVGEINSFKEMQKKEQERILLEKEDFKKLAEIKQKESEEAKQRLMAFEQERTQAIKLNSFLETLGSNIDKRYWGLIDLDKVVVNPESKDIDEDSLKNAVNEFRNSYPEIIQTKTMTNKFPSGAPNKNEPIDYDSWSKLKPSEMAKKLAMFKQ